MSCTQSFYEVFGPSVTAIYKYDTFRIPAVVYVDGYLLAFCEGRKYSHHDWGSMDLLLRRGKVQNSQLIQWEDDLIVVESISGKRTMNPCPIVDEKSNTVVLVFNTFKEAVTEKDLIQGKSYDQTLYVTRSYDLGLTWSTKVNITEDTLGQMNPQPLIYAPGPGHGIQLQVDKHAGRLVIAGNSFWREAAPKNRCSDAQYKIANWWDPFSYCVDQSVVIMSDDGGHSWTCGGVIEDAVENHKYICANESQVAELEDGRLYVNSRTIWTNLGRQEAFSSDGGETFTQGRISGLEEPGILVNCNLLPSIRNYGGCEGSVLSIEPPERLKALSKAKQWVLFSNPADHFLRQNVSVRLSMDNCNTWSKPYTLFSGPSAYSDLVCFHWKEKNEVVLGCLYECGECLHPCEKIVFQIFELEDLLKHEAKHKSEMSSD